MAAPGLVQSFGDNSANSATTHSLTLPAAPTAGNILAFVAGGDKNIGALTMPAGWNVEIDSRHSGASLYLFWKVAAPSDQTTAFSWATTAPSGVEAWVGEFSQAGSGNWLIGAKVAFASANATSYPSGNTGPVSVPEARALAAAVVDSGTSLTPANASFSDAFARFYYTTSNSSRPNLQLADKTAVANDVLATTFSFGTGGTTDDGHIGILAFGRAAPSGDVTPPTVPTGVSAVALNATQAQVSWTASTDAVGVASYRVQRGGVTLGAGSAVASSPFVDSTAVAGASYTYTVSAVDAAGNRSAESAGAPVTMPSAVVLSRIVGIPSATATQIKAKTASATSVRVKVATDAALTAGVVFTAAQTPTAEGMSTHTVSGLVSGTRYYYKVAVTDGTGETLDAVTGEFRTAPTGQASYAFTFASCSSNATNAAAGAVAARKDDFFLHLGDFYYADATGTDLANIRAKMDARMEGANYSTLFAQVPTSFTPNDHDGMNDGSYNGSDPTAWANWNTAYREKFPNLDLPGGATGAYRTWTWGRVRFIQWDCRSFRTASGGTMLGATQKQWTKDTIAAATEPVIVIAQGDVWIGTDGTSDTWRNYTAERTELGNFFAASGKGIVMLGGDMHASAADDGTNSAGGVAVFHASPLSQTSSHKGGPYSSGTPYPAAGVSSTSQYGRVVVTDTGSQISLAFTGYDSADVSRVALTKTYPNVVPTGRVIDKWNGSALVRQVTSHWNGSALTTRITEV